MSSEEKMEKMQLTVKNRNKEERASLLRQGGFVPGVIYNHGKSDSIKISQKDIQYLFSHGISESTLIEVDREGEKETAFVKDYQLHPVSDEILHLDLYRITYGEKIKTSIKINLVGKPEGVKEGGILETFLHEVEIETFPKHLVPSLDLDVSALKIGDSLHVSHLVLPPETKVLTEGDPAICAVAVSAKAVSEADTTEETEAEEETAESKE